MRNGLPKRSLKTECGILNLDVEHGSGTHWTCWYKLDSTHCYYFDSYGLTSPSEFDDYIKMDIQVSPYNIQTDYPNICGHLCLIFLYECVIKKEPGLNTVLKLNQFFSYKNVRSWWTISAVLVFISRIDGKENSCTKIILYRN